MSRKAVRELQKLKEVEFKNIDIEKVMNSNEDKVLLLGEHKEEQEVLDKIGLARAPKKDELAITAKRTAMAERIYKGNSFTGKQIKSLCHKYDLKLLPAKYFKGTIPDNLGKKILEFSENSDESTNISKESFYILAPSSMFMTRRESQSYDEPTPVDSKEDPILFYKEKDSVSSRIEMAGEKDVFIQVSNWGNDFSFFRRFNFMFDTETKNDSMSMLARTMLALLFIAIGLLASLAGNFILATIAYIVSYFWLLLTTDKTLYYFKLWNNDKY